MAEVIKRLPALMRMFSMKGPSAMTGFPGSRVIAVAWRLVLAGAVGRVAGGVEGEATYALRQLSVGGPPDVLERVRLRWRVMRGVFDALSSPWRT